MKARLLLLLALALVTESFSQVSLYSENFDSGGTPFALNAADLGGANVVNTWLINNSYLGGSGTITCLGFPFTFTINSVSNQPAGITNFPNSNYMHITAQSGIANAVFCGSYAAADGICVLEEPNFTKMSAPINTIGYSNVSLDFWWVCGGSPDAYGEVYYSLDGGVSWNLKQSLYNNSTSWTQATTLSDPLWDNAASLMIGYNFINIAAGTAMDPGFSIDDVSITGLVAVNTIATANDFTPSSWCHGPEVAGAISFVSTGIYNPSNIYYAELSDGAGSFAAPITIGSLTSSATGSLSIPVTVSGAASAGSGYRVRVVATDPSTTGTDNASDIVIYTPPKAIIILFRI